MTSVEHWGQVSSTPIHIVSSSELQTLGLQHMEQAGIEVFYLNGASILDKRSLLENMARVMKFPDYFGMNLDALVDCLGDLSWIPAKGYVLVLQAASSFLNSDAELFKTFLSVLAQSAKEWEKRHIPFHVVLVFEHWSKDTQIGSLKDVLCVHESEGE